jgi:hypothetical protein
MDTLPPQRAAVLKAVAVGETPDSVRLPRTTRNRVVDDLKQVELLTDSATLREDADRLFTQAGLMAAA